VAETFESQEGQRIAVCVSMQQLRGSGSMLLQEMFWSQMLGDHFWCTFGSKICHYRIVFSFTFSSGWDGGCNKCGLGPV